MRWTENNGPAKAGQHSHKDDDRNRQQQTEGGGRGQDDHRGGSRNFADDRERASEAGRTGGRA